ncbi:alpha/beta hydrolase [Noviherbaspirillum sp. 17J57-3]|uniref:Alpha/beta hydrolase n=2 Tax=Noviherbaspirillum galbum TaxID=2709383 RepID=A0A6B3SZ99_9BURK|nr:alpha/beta hydrolase [Noviherbaspirillum galbum]
MHGLGEHGGRYAHVARFFNALGWSVRAHDHRGHGRSGGPRGDTPDNDAILSDAKRVFDDFASRLGQAPVLFGHSMGGLFAARYATGGMSPLGGLILSSPALRVRLSGVQRALHGMMQKLAPGFGAPNGVKARYLSHDPAIEKAYRADPLVHGRISARLLTCMLDAIDFSHAAAPTVAVPTLMVVAGDDRLVDAAGSQAFFSRLRKSDMNRLHCYQDFYHEIFNEKGKERVFDDVLAWVRGLEQVRSAAQENARQDARGSMAQAPA